MAALNGRDAGTEAFIKKEAATAKLSYADDAGRHAGFVVKSLNEYRDERINLRTMIDTGGANANVNAFLKNQIDTRRDASSQLRYDAGFATGQKDARRDSTILGDVGNFIGGIVSIPKYLIQSATSDKVGMFDEMRENAAYSTLLRIQGRQSEMGYIAGRKMEDLVRTAPVNVLTAELGGAALAGGVRVAVNVSKAGADMLGGTTTIIRIAEILDRNGVVIAIQNAKTGGYEAVAQQTTGAQVPALLQGPGVGNSAVSSTAKPGVLLLGGGANTSLSGGQANSVSGLGLRESLARDAGIPRSLENVWGSNLSDLKGSYQMDGYTVVDKAAHASSSGNAQIFKVEGNPLIKEVQYSPLTADHI